MAKKGSDIIFTGTQTGKNLATLYSHASLFVHPSLNEGMPIAVLEAMSYGLPVLSSDILEHRDLIRDKEMMFKAGSIESLSNKLSQILKTSATKLKKMGKQNHSAVEKYFNWDKIVLEIANCYAAEDNEPVPVKKLKIA
jgi:glycosyltransferase involved in cell wall biosynthesis